MILYPMNEIDSIDIDTYSDLDTAGLTRMLMRRRSEHAEAAGWRR